MSQEAKYANGESILSQAHATGKIEPAYTNGESGGVPFDQYVAISFLPIYRRGGGEERSLTHPLTGRRRSKRPAASLFSQGTKGAAHG